MIKEKNKVRKQGEIQWWYLLPLFLVCVVMILLVWPREDNSAYLGAEHQVEGLLPTQSAKEQAWTQIENSDVSVTRQLGTRVLVLPKSEGMRVAVTEDDYVHRRVTITVTGLESESLKPESIRAVYGDTVLPGSEAFGDNPVEVVFDACEILYSDATDGTKTATLSFSERTVYECRVAEDDAYVYLDWYRPKELYDRIIVLDAGHGGADEGAIAKSGLMEKDITLSYLLGIKALADKQSEIKFYYTRLEDKNCSEDYGEGLTLRTDLVANVQADIFISIHLNSHESNNFSGTEMFYNETQNDWPGFHSKALAELLMEKVTEALGTRNNGYGEAAETLSMVKYCEVPVTLIELGYLSNADDLTLITDKERKSATEQAIFEAIKEAFRRLDK